MNSDEATSVLKAFGYTINNGYVFIGKYRYGLIGDDTFLPEGESSTPLSWSDIDYFSDCNQGYSGHYLDVTKTDGDTIRLERSELPDPSTYSGLKPNPNGNGFIMPSSLAELSNAWRYIFPDFNAKCWKDVPSAYIRVDLSMIGGENVVVDLSDELITDISIYVQNTLAKLGCRGKAVPKSIIKDVLSANAHRNQKNAFLDMMRSRKWDGQSRLDRVFIDVFGGKISGLSNEESEKVLIDVCKCLFIGGAARQFKAIQLDIIPVLRGLTGTGKSSAIKWIATDNSFCTEALDLREQKFVETSMGKLVVEMSEMHATKRSNVDYSKGFISRSSDHIRLPYDKFPIDNIRRYIIIGSTNDEEFLTDPTGNRRYFPFEVNPDRATVHFENGGFRSEEAKEYILQVWAEALHRYYSNEKWDLEYETIQLAKKCQEAALISDPNVGLLAQLVDDVFPEKNDLVCLKDLSFLLEKHYGITPEDARSAAMTWWGIPHPEWGPSENNRIGFDSRRGWMSPKLKEKPSLKSRKRLYKQGDAPPVSSCRLGE